MPIKRRATKRRLDELTSEQEQHLIWGTIYFPAWPPRRRAPSAGRAAWSPFADDAHRREAWSRHRDRLLAEWDRYAARPAAFWEYEGGWPEGAVGEAHAVHLLADTPPEHRAKIEEDWLRHIGVA